MQYADADVTVQWRQQFYPAVTRDTNIDQSSVPSYSRMKFLPQLYCTVSVAVKLQESCTRFEQKTGLQN